MSKRVVAFSKVVRGFLVALILMLGMGQTVEVEAATSAQKENFKKEMQNMFHTLDTSKHNVSKYKITVQEFNELYDEMQYGEGTEIFGGYYPSTYITYAYSSYGGYVQTIQIKDANADALKRYNAMLPQVEKVLDGIEADMTDLDKVIYLHDAVVEMVSYGGTTDAKYIASGAFIEQKAVCAGYAKALNILLRRVGLDATYVKGTSLNHGWTYVELDGEWYHVDPTWDDTRSTVAGQTYRVHLLKNDAEFSKDHGVWTLKRINEASDSTLYRDWFVHDIVGKMSFEDGLWYYLDTANQVVMASDSLGKHREIVFNYAELGKVKLIDAIDNQLILEVNGQKLSKSIEEWKQVVEDKGEVSGPVEIPEDKDTVNSTDNNTTSMKNAFDVDMNDLSNWKSGHYNEWTGTHAQNPKRICLNDLVENTEKQYRIKISNETYGIVVRELNDKKRIITSVELRNGDLYVPGEGTEYLAISLYNCKKKDEYAVYYSEYEALFANGFEVGFYVERDGSAEVPEEEEVTEVPKQEEEVEVPEANKPVEIPEDKDTVESTDNNTTSMKNAFDVDMNDLSNWKSGHYNEWTGTHAQNPKRICLNDLVENTEKQYRIKISNETYGIVVRELNDKKRIITSVELRNGDLYVPGEGTEYLAISLYNCKKKDEYAVYYSEYEALFANGFEVGFYVERDGSAEVPEEEEVPEVPKQEEEIEVPEAPKQEEEVEVPEANKPVEIPEDKDTVESTDNNTASMKGAFDVDMNDLSNWKSGHYNEWTGTHAQNPKRICLNDLVENTEKQYRIKISNETYGIVVRELNDKKRIITSVELRNGDLYVPGEGTEYLAISLYNCKKKDEYAVYYSEYEALFANGFEVGFYVERDASAEE